MSRWTWSACRTAGWSVSTIADSLQPRRRGCRRFAARVHSPEAPFEGHPLQRRSLTPKRRVTANDERLGPYNGAVFSVGRAPRTMVEAVILRCARQRTPPGESQFPLIGSMDRPRYTGERKGAAAESQKATAKTERPAAQEASHIDSGSSNPSRATTFRSRQLRQQNQGKGGIAR